jgi:membrane associated rhomboid family serine protease
MILIALILAVFGLYELSADPTKAVLILDFALWSQPDPAFTLPVFLPYLTHMFFHGGALHMVINLLMLIQVAPFTERSIASDRSRTLRFLVYYILCGVCGGLGYVLLNQGSQNPLVGASGALSGVFGGYLLAALHIARANPAMKRAVLESAAIFLVINVGLAAIARVTGFLPIAWESHLFGFLAGLALWPLLAQPIRAPDSLFLDEPPN